MRIKTRSNFSLSKCSVKNFQRRFFQRNANFQNMGQIWFYRSREALVGSSNKYQLIIIRQCFLVFYIYIFLPPPYWHRLDLEPKWHTFSIQHTHTHPCHHRRTAAATANVCWLLFFVFREKLWPSKQIFRWDRSLRQQKKSSFVLQTAGTTDPEWFVFNHWAVDVEHWIQFCKYWILNLQDSTILKFWRSLVMTT